MRRILAIGGGSFLMEDGPSPIDALVLRLTGKAKRKLPRTVDTLGVELSGRIFGSGGSDEEIEVH